jgi:WD40 repeat protein
MQEAAHLYTINAVALSPDGQLLATASRDKRIRIWDAATGQLIQSLDTVRDQGHRHSVNALHWTANGYQLISASDDRTLCFWNAV